MATQALPSYLTASTFTTVIGGVTQTQVETVVVSSLLPTQQLPTYLSASTFTATVDGVETTGTTLVEVPLTYIGPSVSSLDFGTSTGLQGSTTPASITSTQSSSPTAIPSSSTESSATSASTSSSSIVSSSPASSALTSSSSSSSSSSASSVTSTEPNSSSSISSTSPASSSSAAPGAIGSKGLSAGQLAGIIIAAIVAAIVIALLAILCFYRRRRRRRGAYEHPNMSDFVIIDSEGQTRFAGEGSPRPTGEEEDSFLRRSGEAVDEMREIGPTARLVNNPSPTATEMTTGTTVPPEGIIPSALKTPTGSPSPPLGPKLPSPFFHASASSLFFNPSRGPDQSLVGAAVGAAKRDSASTRASSTSASPVSPSNGNAGNIIPPRQLMQMDDQWRQESNGGGFGIVGLRHRPSELGERMQTGTPLRPPPAFGMDTSSSRQDLSSTRTAGSHPESPGSDDDERATLLMAHRFNMNEGGPTVLVQADNETSSPSSWQSSLGLGLHGLARISRLSWFQRMDANRTHSPGSAMPTTRSGSPMHQLRSAGTRSSLVVPRPVSNLTTSSTGDTVFYDAPSGPSTMSTRSGHGHGRNLSQRPTSMPPLPPRAVVTPVGVAANSAPQTPRPRFDSYSDSGSGFNQPALLLLDPSSAPGSPRFSTPPPVPMQPQNVEAHTEPLDILDTPVPARAAVSPFSTTSTRGGPAVPPGLEHLANIRSWRDSSSDMPSSATFGSHSDHGVNVDVVGGGGDVLEEAPPLPRANWTQLRAVTVAGTIDSNRTRRTLGQLDVEDPHDDVRSTAGSLHSIPDRLSPLSPMGSGSNSRAPSRQYNSSSLGSNSNSSRFSRGPSPLGGNGNGNGTSGSSGSQLGHSNSITSDGRRRPRREPGEPPAISPANSSHFHRARLSAIGGHRTPITTPQRSPAADAAFLQGATSAMNEGTGELVGRTT